MPSIALALKKASSFYAQLLLGIYVSNKVLLLLETGLPGLSAIDRLVILPMGCMTILYLASSVRVILEEGGVHHRLYEILVALFATLALAAYLFISFLPV